MADHITLTLTAEEVETIIEMAAICRDALDCSMSHVVLWAHIGHDECDAVEAKAKEALRPCDRCGEPLTSHVVEETLTRSERVWAEKLAPCGAIVEVREVS